MVWKDEKVTNILLVSLSAYIITYFLANEKNHSVWPAKVYFFQHIQCWIVSIDLFKYVLMVTLMMF